MIAVILSCVVTVLVLVVMIYVARGPARPVHSVQQLLTAIRPVDVAAFRNLTGGEEEAYLRAKLPAADFGRVQRARARAAAEYVRCTAHNAALLIRMGDAARGSQTPEIARAGAALAEEAMQLRIRSLQALVLLWLGVATPQTGLRLSSLVDRYMRMRDEIVRLTRLQSPAVVSRLEAVL